MTINPGLLTTLKALPVPACIGISGFGGAGKTTLARELAAALNCPVVGVDAFIKDKTQTKYTNWDLMDFKRLQHEVLIPFSRGANEIVYGHFDWAANAILENVALPKSERLIVEGVGLFRPELLQYLTYRIWVDCPLEEAITRGKQRDREEYGEPHDELWEGLWKENDIAYFEASNPKETAHTVVECTGNKG